MPQIVPPVPMPATKWLTRPGGLAPDLRSGRPLVRGRVLGVVVLVGVEGSGDLLGEARRHRVVRVRVVRRHRRRAQDHLGPVGAKQRHLLGGHLVGHDEHAPVATPGGDDGEPDAGVARGALDDGRAGPEQPVALGRLDHRRRGPVLDAPARVEELELGDERAGQVPADAVEAHHRGVADEVEERVGHLHRRPAVGERHDLDPGEVLAVRQRPRRCAARSAAPRVRSFAATSAAPGADDARPGGGCGRGSRRSGAGVTSAEGSVTTWCARAARRSGGWSVPTTTSRSMATCWPTERPTCLVDAASVPAAVIWP